MRSFLLKGDCPLGQSLNGVPFALPSPTAWDLPDREIHGETPIPATEKRVSSGTVIREPDGRVWLCEPANHYGGIAYSFASGKVEPGLSPQTNARKKTLGGMGLVVQVVDWLGDVETPSHYRRYYLARRVGGAPQAHGEKAWDVLLAPLAAARALANTPVDQALLYWLCSGKRHQHGEVASMAPNIRQTSPPQPRLL